MWFNHLCWTSSLFSVAQSHRDFHGQQLVQRVSSKRNISKTFSISKKKKKKTQKENIQKSKTKVTRRHWKQSKSTLVQRVRLQSLSKDRRIDLGMNYCDMRKGRLAAGKFSAELQGRLVFSTLNRNLFQIRGRSIQTHHFPINFSPLHKILTEMTIDNFFWKIFFTELFSQKVLSSCRSHSNRYGRVLGIKYKWLTIERACATSMCCNTYVLRQRDPSRLSEIGLRVVILSEVLHDNHVNESKAIFSGLSDKHFAHI